MRGQSEVDHSRPLEADDVFARRPVRLGLLLASLSEAGGAEAVARSWIRGAADRGHEVVCLLYGSDPAPADLPCDVVEFGRHAVADRWLRLPRWVRATARAHRLDVIVSVMDFSNITLLRAFYGRADRPGLVVSEHSVPDVLWGHEGSSGHVKRQLARRLYPRADAAIAVSHAVATDLRIGLGVPADRTFVVPNTVPAVAATASRHPVTDARRRVLLVGRLYPVKRAERLIETMAELLRRDGDWSALVIGDGPSRPDLEEAAQRSRLPVEFAGWQEPWQHLVGPGDCLLLPSDIEGFGNVLVEAAAAGVAAVAPSTALGVADAMLPGVTGVLARSVRAADLADALEEAAQLSWDAADIAGWLANFAPAAAAERLEAVALFATAGRSSDAQPLGDQPVRGRLSRRRLTSGQPACRPHPVTHVGPGPGGAGGMSSIIGDYAEMPFTRYAARFRPSWSAASPLWSLGPFLRALAQLALLRPPRLGVVHVHVSKDGSFAREGALVLVSAARKLPTVVTLHGGRFPEFEAQHPRLARTVLQRADRIVALGSTARGSLSGALQRKAVIVPNAVALPPEVGTPAGDCGPVALFAGEVTRLKGVDTLVAAWPLVRKQVPDARLIIVGPPGGDMASAGEVGIEWRGQVSREEVQLLLLQCRVAVLPSREEAMPMYVLEAMAAARPVVSTPVGEVTEAVGGSGIIVPVGDSPELAAAITRLFLDDSLASRLGATGRARIECRFGVRPIAQALEQVYDEARRLHPNGRGEVRQQAG